MRRFVFVLVMVAAAVRAAPISTSSGEDKPHYTNSWAVQVHGGPKEADILANKYGFENLGQVSCMRVHYAWIFFGRCRLARVGLISRMFSNLERACSSCICKFEASVKFIMRLREVFAKKCLAKKAH